MNGFLSPEAAALAPYVPGEQPRDQAYVKLNTNESPFPPSPRVLDALSRTEAEALNLYPDPACTRLREAAARRYGLEVENVAAGNGSDEILAFAFRAFCGTGRPAAYADVTYGFYRAQTALFGLDAHVVPLREDFTLRVEDYRGLPGMVVLANPNAPTGLAVPLSDIEVLLNQDPDRVVLVDEAYVDFGGETCVPLTARYRNLLVVQTCSKSRSLAGGRVGFAFGDRDLIEALHRVKFSFHPYSLNRLSLLAGAAALEDEAYFRRCTAAIQENRAWTAERLRGLGFSMTDSLANFLFVRPGQVSGAAFYRGLKARGVLVRWFDEPRLRDSVRVTVGSREQMEAFVQAAEAVLEAEA